MITKCYYKVPLKLRQNNSGKVEKCVQNHHGTVELAPLTIFSGANNQEKTYLSYKCNSLSLEFID